VPDRVAGRAVVGLARESALAAPLGKTRIGPEAAVRAVTREGTALGERLAVVVVGLARALGEGEPPR